MKRGHWQILLAAVLFLLALGLTLYPVVSNWYIGRHQSRIQTEYREVLEQTDSAEIESIRESAVAYNKTITPGAAEEAYSQASIRLAAEDYVNQLNVSGSGIMGYVEIPKIGVDLPIYHGTGADSLDRGTGHLLGSSLPVGGESTHMILAVLLFVKIATAYMDYRKHGQFEFTAPAILFACLLFSLTAPSYIWNIL